MQLTSISWADCTWGPIRGCSRVSAGCARCYGARMASRFCGVGQPFEGFAKDGNWTGKGALIPEKLNEPLRMRKPRRIFANSMSDLFHENLSDHAIDRVFAVMALAHQHTFMVLTKRPARMRAYLDLSTDNREEAVGRQALNESAGANPGLIELPLPNVQLGVSVEDQPTADERIPLLLQTPAAVRFVSFEPALGPTDFTPWLRIAWQCSGCRNFFPDPCLKVCPKCGREDYWTGSHEFNPPGGQRGSGIDWVILGGETGPGARPMDPAWARSVRDQCKAAGVPFFFKPLARNEKTPVDLMLREFPREAKA